MQQGLPNPHYPLWRVARAPTAAPTYFAPEAITVEAQQGRSPVKRKFVDGGASLFNNPALQALMYTARLPRELVAWCRQAGGGLGGHRFAEPVERREQGHRPGNRAKLSLSLMDDYADLMEIILQWVSRNPTRESSTEKWGHWMAI